ncbi:Gfo/Idh/MocA family oxidoreductase [Candidatus Woesearchaeota archaeon]|nr:Gfo/Idh/MocA family oxidoreductase [Candidatus Woesearchaeota archaeon]
MAKIRVALIGLGYWGSKHLEFFKNSSEIEIVYLCDKNKILPDSNFVKDYRDIDVTKIDFVDVVTSEETHFEIADYFLSKDVYVFLEKPLCVDSEDLNNFSKNPNHDKLMVGYLYNFDKALDSFFENNSDLNSLNKIEIIWNDLLLRDKSCSIVADLGPHVFSILNRFSENINIDCVEKSKLLTSIYGTIKISERFVPFYISLSWNSEIKQRLVKIHSNESFTIIDCLNGCINLEQLPKYYTLSLELEYFINVVRKQQLVKINSLDYGIQVFKLWFPIDSVSK